MATKTIQLTPIKCNRCGGEINASEFETESYVCLVLSCKECNTIVDKVWKRKRNDE